MKIEDVLKLVDAGFNKEEIIKITAEPKHEEEKVEEPEKEEEKEKTEEKPAEDTGAMIKNLEAQIKALTEAFHERNIRETDSKSDIETADDVLRKMFEG